MKIPHVELNSRSQIILSLLEDLSLDERLDIMAFLEELTEKFYNLKAMYIKAGADEMGAKELAMADIKEYAIAEDKEELDLDNVKHADE